MEKRRGSTTLLVIVVALISVALTCGAIWAYLDLSGKMVIEKSQYEETVSVTNTYQKLLEIQNTIDEYYLFDYDKEEQMELVYRALLDGVGDPYTRYLSEEDLEELRNTVNGVYTGTGLLIAKRNDTFVIAEVISDSPAGVAGLKTGDIIQEIDGKTVSSEEEITALLQGDPGSTVTIKYKRGSADPKEVKLVRGEIQGNTVESREVTEGGNTYTYIKLSSFGDDTYSEFDAALSAAEQNGSAGLIIDLRNNPGGFFDVGIKIADRLLPKCDIGYTKDRAQKVDSFQSTDEQSVDMPIIVLTNENTASTAEILASTLQYNGAARTIGGTTYGKGIIQETRMLSDGSAFNITVKEFFLPNGEKINEVGVLPDIEIEAGNGTTDTVLERAIKELSSFNTD